ncbi:MAG: ATP-binding cassette domain-containing protein, partial [Planctomycetes bacterium]|nr:ATP-binding cassette domain-containing protein [Planctomycetota bacterium]
MSAPLLEATGLRKVYGRREVVCGVSLEVRAGEVVGLLGPNGAGKTTTFRMVMGMVEPTGGSVRLCGEEVTRLPVHLRARAGLGYLAQEPSIFQRLTVEENLLAILEFIEPDRAARRARIEESLERYGLAKLRAQPSSRLSGGERRRLEVARALLGRPKVMLLDEPFSGVDPIAVG